MSGYTPSRRTSAETLTTYTSGGDKNDVAILDNTGLLRVNYAPSAVTFTSATPLIASTTDASSYSTAAFGLTNGASYLIFVAPTAASAIPSVNSITKTGLTSFTELGFAVNNVATGRVSVWKAQANATTSSALTVTLSGTATGCFVSVVQLANDSFSDLGTLDQFAVSTGIYSGPPVTMTENTDEWLAIGAAQQVASATAPGLDTGYTDVHNGTIATPSTGFRVKYTNAASDTMSFSGVASQDIIGAAVWVQQQKLRITGLTGGIAGRQITLRNVSSTRTIYLVSASASSAAANRFLFAQTEYPLGAGQSINLAYDEVLGNWVATDNFPARTSPDGLIVPGGDVNVYHGQVQHPTGPVPFAFEVGSTTISLSAAASGFVTVNFTAGRFSRAPIVFVTQGSLQSGSAKLIPKVNSNVTTSSADIYVYTGDGTTTTVTGVILRWLAIQMDPT